MATSTSPGDQNGNKTPGFVALGITMIILVLICTLIRIWARVIIRQQKFWWDDWFAILAALVSMTQNALDIYVGHLGFGKHITAIPAEQQISFFHWLWINIMIWGASIAIPKYSVIFMYVRAFHVDNMAIKISLWVAGFLNTCFLIYNIFSAAFQCTPVKKAWLGPLVDGHCIDSYAWYMSINVFDFLIDIYLLILPFPILWFLQIDFKRKVYIMLVFLAGYSVIVVTIGRLVTLARTEKNFELDASWAPYEFDVWASLEAPLCIFCMTIPSLNNIVKRAMQHGFGSLFTPKTYDRATAPYSTGSGHALRSRDKEEYLNLNKNRFSINNGAVDSEARGAGLPESRDEISDHGAIPLDEIHVHTNIDVQKKPTGPWS